MNRFECFLSGLPCVGLHLMMFVTGFLCKLKCEIMQLMCVAVVGLVLLVCVTVVFV